MSDTSLLRHKELSSGDAAIDGLFGGVMAGLAMAVFLVAAGLTVGDDPSAVLSRFTPGGAQSPMAGLIAHLAVSGIYGALFGLIYRIFARRWLASASVWVSGLAGGMYGLALWLVAQAALLPGVAASLRDFPRAHFLLAHLIFGVVLGVTVIRNMTRGR